MYELDYLSMPIITNHFTLSIIIFEYEFIMHKIGSHIIVDHFFLDFFVSRKASLGLGFYATIRLLEMRQFLISGRFWTCLYHLNRLKYWFFCQSVISVILSQRQVNMKRSAKVRWLPTKKVRDYKYFCRYYIQVLFTFLNYFPSLR